MQLRRYAYKTSGTKMHERREFLAPDKTSPKKAFQRKANVSFAIRGWYDFGFYIAIISGFGGLSLFRRKKYKNIHVDKD